MNLKECEKCGEEIKVKNVRRFKNGLRRRRYCPFCKDSFTTREILDDEYKALLKCVESVDVLKRLLNLKEQKTYPGDEEVWE